MHPGMQSLSQYHAEWYVHVDLARPCETLDPNAKIVVCTLYIASAPVAYTFSVQQTMAQPVLLTTSVT